MVNPVEGANYTPAVITATAAVSVWMFGKISDYITKYKEKTSKKDALIKSLHAEVSFNKIILEEFIEDASINGIEHLLEAIRKNRELIPHITDAKHVLVYEKNIENIHFFGDEAISRIIEFYSHMARIRVIIEGLQLKSFTTISDHGRSEVVRSVYTACDIARHTAQKLLNCLQDNYPVKENQWLNDTNWVSRFENEPPEALSRRLDSLDTDIQKALKKAQIRSG